MTITRGVPTWTGVRPFLRFDRPTLARTQARLNRAQTIADLRAIAARRVPRMVFDYVDGAAEQEIGLGRARDTFRDIEFTPRVLRDVSAVDTATTVGGRAAALPFRIAPTGLTRLMHTAGEFAGVAAAHGNRIPFALSTMGSVALERVAAAAPHTDLWFQLYLWRDRAKSTALVDRARDAGYRTLILTADTPVGGARLRDARNVADLTPEHARVLGHTPTPEFVQP